ncbi:class I SAM-dependent methyltransferase [Candidatus Magnetominusculus xianensis]|uniref:Methyltransferase n=1 Tax=Candidatus Magnetominusculus xianensis TaxID=1748249 RepID=A0ABR5SFW6_9BACT|nr:class I SAM-dependent methyltransferase [Candidatus Magnetominusculus xianensis]KWT84957.1 methyltransferase [Candidatus Magnetominusculus xianensis]MBF0404462.1 methyltransferase domain-containing protein [Nitrospirota bacterium]
MLTDIFKNIFRCPDTGEMLREEADAFVSVSGKRWPIKNNIPRFVSSDMYVGSFSFEWNLHDTTQIDSLTGENYSEQFFRQKTGLSPEDIQGKLVLDAGVGAGRFSDIVIKWGANVVGIDLSYSVEAAYRNLGSRENIIIAQADIDRPPFAHETFDYIISIGVLHHTPDTRAYFQKLIPLLKKGGEICIWVYPSEGSYRRRAAWIPFTNKIPTKWFYRWCQIFVPFATEHYRIFRFLTAFFPFSNSGIGVDNDILDTFDCYSPKYHGIHSPDEVVAWFEECGLGNIQTFSFKTAVRGKK